ncbi:MAG: hypothetical protein ACPG3U_05870 [Rhodothermales bacterium]
MGYPTSLLDYGELSGGLVRMMERFKEEGNLTKDPEADQFLMDDPNAALLGMLYDQRVLAEYAFTGPIRLKDRLGHLDMKKIADMDLDVLREHFAEKPAVHRFTNVMADRTHQIAQILVDEYDSDAANMWNDGAPFTTIEKRLVKLPGFGKMKAKKMKYVLHYFGYRDFSEE